MKEFHTAYTQVARRRLNQCLRSWKKGSEGNRYTADIRPVVNGDTREPLTHKQGQTTTTTSPSTWNWRHINLPLTLRTLPRDCWQCNTAEASFFHSTLPCSSVLNEFSNIYDSNIASFSLRIEILISVHVCVCVCNMQEGSYIAQVYFLSPWY